MAVGTATVTEELLGNIKKVTFAWVAGTAGEAGTVTKATTYPYTGILLKVVTVPGTGADQPDDNYNITLTDEDGIDVANSQCLLRDETTTEWEVDDLGAIVGDKLTLNVDSAGSGLKGTCIAYIGVTDAATANVNVENALYGAAGITTWPAAAAPADGVSISEGLRYVVESQIGALTNTGAGADTLTGILGDVASSSIATRLTAIMAEIVEVEGHFHTRERWFAKNGAQAAEVWGSTALLTPYRAISGNNVYGADANDEALVFGTANTLIAGQTKADMNNIMIADSSVTTVWKLRIIYGSGTMADAITAGQYSEVLVRVASASSRIAVEDIRMPRITIGTDKIWVQGWNATDNATIDFFVGIHGYTV